MFHQSKIFIIIIIFIVSISCSQNKNTNKLKYSENDLKKLLIISKKSILEQLKKNQQKSFKDIIYTDAKLGVAVRLKKNKKERGCIAFIQGVSDIQDVVKTASIDAAFFDPRFIPLTEPELKNLEIEITIISNFKKIKNFNDIIIGLHSLYLNDYVNHGFLQASVAVEENYDKIKFLKALCRKSKVQEDAYKQKRTRIYRAESVYFKMSFNDINIDK